MLEVIAVYCSIRTKYILSVGTMRGSWSTCTSSNGCALKGQRKQHVKFRGDVNDGKMRKSWCSSIYYYYCYYYHYHHHDFVIPRETHFHKHFAEIRWHFRILYKLNVRRIYGSFNIYGNAFQNTAFKKQLSPLRHHIGLENLGPCVWNQNEIWNSNFLTLNVLFSLVLFNFSKVIKSCSWHSTEFIMSLQSFKMACEVSSILTNKYEGWNFNSGNYLFTTDTK